MIPRKFYQLLLTLCLMSWSYTVAGSMRRRHNLMKHKKPDHLDICQFPSPNWQTYEKVCGLYHSDSPYICDPHDILGHTESELIDSSLSQYRFTSCFCGLSSKSCQSGSPAGISFAVAVVDKAKLPWQTQLGSQSLGDWDNCNWPRTINATAQYFADRIRHSWNDRQNRSNICTTDVLLLVVFNWTDKTYRNLQTISVSHSPKARHLGDLTLVERWGNLRPKLVNHVLYVAANISRFSRRYQRQLRVESAPRWAVGAIFGLSGLSLLLAGVGNYIARSRLRKYRHSGITHVRDKSWKAGFSGGVWGKQQPQQTHAAVSVIPRPRGLFMRWKCGVCVTDSHVRQTAWKFSRFPLLLIHSQVRFLDGICDKLWKKLNHWWANV